MIRLHPSWLPAIASAMLGILVFSVSIGGTYIYDDPLVIQEDPRIAHPGQWYRFWTEKYIPNVDNLYRPLVSMSYAIQWWLHGDRPWAFHLVNVLLHGAVCACVAELARRLIGRSAAWVAGLLFAVHPIHSEAVALVSGRPELMCALGILGALILSLEPMSIPRAFAVAGCGLVAILSKEQGVLLPLLILLLLWTRKTWPISHQMPAQAGTPARRRTPQVLALLLCFILAGYIVVRETHPDQLKFWWDRSFIDWTSNPLSISPRNPHNIELLRDRMLLPVVVLGHYTALLIVPLKLSIDYGAGVIGWKVHADDPYLWIGLLAVLGWFLAMGIAITRKSAAAVFALLALGLTYGMIGNIVAYIGTIFGERLMYTPSAFVLILLAAAVSKLPGRAIAPLLAIAIVLGGIRSATYASRVSDRLRFYQLAHEEQPRSIRLYITLAGEYLKRGMLQQAETVARHERQFMPEYYQVWLQSGQIAMEMHRFDEARSYLERATKMQPENMQGWLDLLERRRRAFESTAPSSTTQSS